MSGWAMSRSAGSRCGSGASSRVYVAAMPVDQAKLDAAIEALSDRERFREAESVVSAAAPRLQRILADALTEGGWFGEAHEAEVRKAAEASSAAERMTAISTLLAEEARMGMMVGVAVGWALAEELSNTEQEED
jgi:hypothetical protein